MVRLAIAMIVVLVLSGCAKDGQDRSVTGLSPDAAGELNSMRGGGENLPEPKLNAQTHFAAGQLAESHGAAANAIEQYNAALKLDGQHLPSLFRLGVVSAQLKQYPQAVAAWEKYIKATGGNATAYSNLGFCQELAGNAVEAEKAYKQGIAKESANNACRVNYGLMLARSGRSNEATIQLQAVLPDADVHYNLGAVYEQQGHKELARQEYRQAIKANPAQTAAIARLAELE